MGGICLGSTGSLGVNYRNGDGQMAGCFDRYFCMGEDGSRLMGSCAMDYPVDDTAPVIHILTDSKFIWAI